MGSVVVIGLAGMTPADDWASMLEGRVVVARHGESARRSTPPGCTFTMSFDSLLNAADVTTIASDIVGEVCGLAESANVAYLVPGFAVFGDVTVQRIAGRVSVETYPGSLATLPNPGTSVRIIDALELAEAEQRRPFDAGLSHLNTRVRTLVTNFYGVHVRRLTTSRILRTYALRDPYVHSGDDGNVHLDAADALGGATSVSGLLEIVARLRRPDGCPWDREQTPKSMLDDLREEVSEVDAAVESGDWANLAEELGDVLLHVCMQAQIAAELDRFTFEDVVAGIAAKLVRRHPHVFGDVAAATVDDVRSVWQQVKKEEKLAQQHDKS